MIDPFNVDTIPRPAPPDFEFVWEQSYDDTPYTPPTGAMALIPQIWADVLEKSLRKQIDLIGKDLLNASFSKVIYR